MELIHLRPGGKLEPPGGSNVPFAYRILHVNNLDFNLFELMQSKIALAAKNDDMFAQSLAVVTRTEGEGRVLPDQYAGQQNPDKPAAP